MPRLGWRLIAGNSKPSLSSSAELFDVAIIGAGIVGNLVAYELSQFNLRIKVIEKEADIGFGISKGHDAIIHVLQLPFGSLKSRLCLEGNKMYSALAEELDVPLERTSAILVSTNMVHRLLLPFLRLYLGRSLKGFKVGLLSKGQLAKLEPNLRNPTTAIVVERYGLIDTFEMLARLRDSNMLNGIGYEFESEVEAARISDGGIVELTTRNGLIRARYLINAAGLNAQNISEWFGDVYNVRFGRGVSVAYSGRASNHIITLLTLSPQSDTKGGGALITHDGKSLWGPTLVPSNSINNTSVDECDVLEIENKFGRLFKMSPGTRLKAFAGMRAISEGNDFVIECSKKWPNVIHCVGISSPGYTAAPAIAKLVSEMLASAGLILEPKSRQQPKRFERTVSKIIAAQAGEQLGEWGQIVCAETCVSEGEIRQAVRSGCRTLDCVTQRTKLSFMPGQGSDCMLKVIKIMADEMNLSPNQITKKGEGSWILTN